MHDSIKRIIDLIEPRMNMSYQEAVDLALTAEWWRDCAIILFGMLPPKDDQTNRLMNAMVMDMTTRYWDDNGEPA